jgi:hypothetical protein
MGHNTTERFKEEVKQKVERNADGNSLVDNLKEEEM